MSDQALIPNASATAPETTAVLPHTHRSTEVPTRLAIWWFLASEIAIFGGALACYLLYRVRSPEWGDHAAHTLTSAGAINTVVLLTSSLSAVLAHSAARRGEFDRAAKMLWLTVVGGVVFLGIKAFEYTHEISAGLTPVTNTFWSFYYLLTGLHALHVVGGMVAIALVAAAAKKRRDEYHVENVALYWHFVDVVWIFLFPLLYIAN